VALRLPEGGSEHRGVAVRLDRRQGIVVRGAIVRLVPDPARRGGTYPLEYDGRLRVRLTAQTGPLEFRVVPTRVSSNAATLCVPAGALVEAAPA
jgi:hypothetical protein